MKKILFALMMFASLSTFAREDVVFGKFEIDKEDFQKLEEDGEAEIIRVRPKQEYETDQEYNEYLYAVGGLDTHILPINVFVGLGVKDKRGIISGEARLKGNLLGIYGGERNSAVGAGVQAYIHPLKLITKEGSFLGNFYVSAGYTQYGPVFADSSKSHLKNERSIEIGYEFADHFRVGIGKDKYDFSGDSKDMDVYLLKFSVKLGKKKRRY